MNYLESLNKIYNVGIYIRLSREDDEKTYESESITNQKSLLLQYVKENNLRVYDIYVDGGYSGTNFDRPGFKRLIDDIESKKINMVITKDMSRLGRDYIGTGNLIEKYFPEQQSTSRQSFPIRERDRPLSAYSASVRQNTYRSG